MTIRRKFNTQVPVKEACKTTHRFYCDSGVYVDVRVVDEKGVPTIALEVNIKKNDRPKDPRSKEFIK